MGPSLTDGQKVALRNLSKKKTGAAVEFINIADAVALTELGLASRTPQGWVITPAGALALKDVDDDASSNDR